jgi:hypothetical protein
VHLRNQIVIVGMCLFWIPVAIPSVYSQDQVGAGGALPTIPTDRPAITDSRTVVPRSDLLFENGFSETRTDGQSSFDPPGLLSDLDSLQERSCGSPFRTIFRTSTWEGALLQGGVTSAWVRNRS